MSKSYIDMMQQAAKSGVPVDALIRDYLAPILAQQQKELSQTQEALVAYRTELESKLFTLNILLEDEVDVPETLRKAVLIMAQKYEEVFSHVHSWKGENGEPLPAAAPPKQVVEGAERFQDNAIAIQEIAQSLEVEDEDEDEDEDDEGTEPEPEPEPAPEEKVETEAEPEPAPAPEEKVEPEAEPEAEEEQ